MAPVAAGSSPVAHPTFPRAPVAQLDRAPDFESVGRRFDSCRARQLAPGRELKSQVATPKLQDFSVSFSAEALY